MYSPFPQSKISGLELSDIESLLTNSVPEGLFLEYKGTLVSPQKIANSIASFANTYGGWYLVGVQANPTTNIPEQLQGLSSAEFRDPVSTIREAVIEYLSPTPVFFSETVTLSNSNLVVIVQVPDAQNKPIVSKDGRIYRRSGDSSLPVFENNRTVIDRLVEEGRAKEKRFEDFCTEERAFFKYQSENPFINIYIRPYPDSFEGDSALSQPDLERLLADLSRPVSIPPYEPATASVTFDSVRTGPDSIIVSHSNGESTSDGHLSLELFRFGWAKLGVPVTNQLMYKRLKGPEAIHNNALRNMFQSLVEKDNHSPFLRLVEIGNTLTMLILVLELYQRWISERHELHRLQYRIEFRNFWRKIPFFDSPDYVQFVEACGIQMISRDHFWHPAKYQKLRLTHPVDNFPQSLQIAVECLLAIGIPIDVSIEGLRQRLDQSI